MNIPNEIHQTWKSEEMPSAIGQCVSSLRDLNPNWRHNFYTDSDWEGIVKSSQLISWEHFSSYPTAIQRSDLLRCIVMYERGGVYADMDILALRPLDSLISSAIESGLVRSDTEVLLAFDHPIHNRDLYGGREIVMNNFMVASPQAELFRIFVDHLSTVAKNGGPNGGEPVSTTGPLALTQLIEENGGCDSMKVGIVPYFWINPLPDMNLNFPERESFEQIIVDESWRYRFCPFVTHLWWHNYWSSSNMMDMYYKHLFPCQ